MKAQNHPYFSGVSHEMGPAEGADTLPPRRFLNSLEATFAETDDPELLAQAELAWNDILDIDDI